MLDMILVVLSIFWFCNTEYYDSWSKVKIGGDQITVTLTALIIIIYLLMLAYNAARWYYARRVY